MSWPLSRSVVAGSFVLVGLVTLIAFGATSRADGRHDGEPALLEQDGTVLGPVWVPEVVTAPGLPVQCADGSWTRTAVRGGCVKHGGSSL